MLDTEEGCTEAGEWGALRGGAVGVAGCGEPV